MVAINKMLDIALPLLSVIMISILMLPYIVFKLITHVKKLLCPENLARKVVLITGAASGIGEQLAYEYARQGAMLSLIDIREENLAEVADKAKSLGSPDVTTIVADVSKDQDCKRFIDQTVNHFGRLDHLVNNAGIGGPGLVRVESCRDISEFIPVMDINFWGAVYGTLHAIPHLKNSKGRIIVIASGCGWFPLPRLSIYNASKAAVINFFETLRIELGSSVSITIVTPGFIKTDLVFNTIKNKAIWKWIPMIPAFECAKAIVKSACRGDMYLTTPSWVKVMFLWKVLYPEIVDWALNLVFGLIYNTSRKKGNGHLSRGPEIKAE